MIEVIERLVTEFEDIQLYIAGDGELKKIKDIIKEKRLEKNINCVGWVSGSEKERLLKECSVFVLPSYNEGMPMSILEAMAYKNSVISTEVGGIPQIITNNENGIIIKPGDKDELYNALKGLISNTEKRRIISENARKTVEEKFDIINNIEKLFLLYK